MANSTPPNNKRTGRMQREIQSSNQDLAFIRNLEFSEEGGKQVLKGVIVGPEGSDYNGGHFRFAITYPPSYPFKPLELAITTAICHPNIHSKTGEVCLDTLLAAWKPSTTLSTVLTDFRSLLETPVYEIPIEDDDNEKTPDKARRWTQEFASPSQ